MPKFNMSSAEAQALADYFAAVDGATYPYEFESRTSSGYLAEVEAQHPNHLSDALKIITDNNYCVKCHLVGDYEPGGDPKALAPRMERIHERLRPEFVRGWVANPKRFLPYTGMPVNIPHNMPVDQKLYPGTSEQQLNGVVDLLMNFDQFTKRKFSVKPLIKPAAPTPTAPSSAAPASTRTSGAGTPPSGNEASATRRKSSQ
jgi:hypothetical protein